MRIFFISSIIFLTIAVLSACGGNRNNVNSPQVTQIYSGFHCGSDSRAAYIEWVTDPMLLERAFGKLSKQFSADRTPSPVVDFSKDGIAIIHMGQQPTVGYRLSLVSNVLKIHRQIAEIKMEWVKPKIGQMNAQVITNPCIVIKLPLLGYKKLKIVDVSGTVRLIMDRSD